MSEEKKRSFFDCMKNIVQAKNKDILESDISSPTFDTMYSKYMVQRYISMYPAYMKFIDKHQIALESLSNEMHYRFLFKVIPQNRNLWIKYISKGKKKK